MTRWPVLLAVAALIAGAAKADPIRSDLPLWGTGRGSQPIWPQGFSTGDSFGCVSHLRFGDWRWMERDEEDDASRETQWLRISNYGAFHCAAIFQAAYRREGLEHAIADRGFLVGLGRTTGADGVEALFALQVGLNPGSRYYLLAAPVVEDGYERRRYRLLEPDCPRSARRTGPPADIFMTSYCAVNDQRTLIAMARAGARTRSTSWLEWVGDAPGDD